MTRPVLITRASDESWLMAVGSPDPRLRDLVLSYEGFTERPPGDLLCRRQVPMLGVPMVINVGTAVEVVDPRFLDRSFSGAAFVAGLYDAFVTTRMGAFDGVEVVFTVAGARRLLGPVLADMTNRTVTLGDCMETTGRVIAERLAAGRSWAERFDLLDAFLLERLASVPAASADAELALATIAARRGSGPVGPIVEALGWSRREAVSVMRSEYGLPPKAIARVARFEHAAQMLDRGSRPIEVAVAAGFADQAHMGREFRDMAGLSPREYGARVNESAPGLILPGDEQFFKSAAARVA